MPSNVSCGGGGASADPACGAGAGADAAGFGAVMMSALQTVLNILLLNAVGVCLALFPARAGTAPADRGLLTQSTLGHMSQITTKVLELGRQ